MTRGAKLAVVVPAYQEGRFIARTLETLPRGVDLVVVVDDASTDGTADCVRQIRDPRIRLIVHEQNRGVGAAMHPEDFEVLIAPVLHNDADYVKGNRLTHRLSHDMPWGRRIAGRWLGRLTAYATGLCIGDSQCGYTAISAAAARGLPLGELWPRYGYPNDLLGLLSARQFKVVEVPVRPVYLGESSGVRAWHAFVVAYVVFRRWWRERRRTHLVAPPPEPAHEPIPGG
jgi:glycosyltransferase involved in cell wall biosynthesis